MQTIKNIEDLSEKTVLVRSDLNVKITGREVGDQRKFQAALPTIEYLQTRGAKVLVMTHINRPGGEIKEDQRVDPLVEELSKLLNQDVAKLDQYEKDISGDVSNMQQGDVALLENTRFHPDERPNSDEMAQELAQLADVFVLDGFGVVHRDHSSITGVAKLLPSFAGLLIEKEVKNLDRVINGNGSPFSVVLGGVKVATKIPVIANLKQDLDHILLGGAMANTAFHVAGKQIGSSVVDKDYLQQAKKLVSNGKTKLPEDVIVGNQEGTEFRQVNTDSKEIAQGDDMILDIGEKATGSYLEILDQSNTVVFNGAMGLFEQEPYHKGTKAIIEKLQEVAQREHTFVVVGGGDTLQALSMIDNPEAIDFISSGGGAMLSFLAGEDLPGLEVLGIDY